MLSNKKNVLLILAFLFLISSVPGLWNDNGLLYGQKGIEKISEKDSPVNPEFDDGPYIFYRGDSLEALWICQGKVSRKIFADKDMQFFRMPCGSSTEVISIKSKNFREKPAVFNHVSKIAALSDIHGQHELFIRLLKVQSIIDGQEKWSWGDGHLVIVGDIFDRGPQVTETLWFLYKLEDQARAAGGYVHILLGNHELMVLRGDLRYLNPKYEFVSDKLDISYDQLFNRNTVLGRWLRTKPLVVKINHFIFVHGGFHPDFLKLELSIEEVNDTFRQSLDHDQGIIDNDEILAFLYKGNGPLWYRGYFSDKNEEELQIRPLLGKYGVDHIVVGHTSMDEVRSFHGGQVIAVDSSIKKGQSGEIFIWENDQIFRGTLSGQRFLLK
jgi:hypothetical protein